METFGLLLIAVDEYPDPPGALPSSKSADQLAELIIGERGGTLVKRLVAKSREEIFGALERWADGTSELPKSTIVYLVGHGTDDVYDHKFLVPAGNSTVEIPTASFRPVFEKNWIRRQRDRTSWTLFVLDCCAADIGLVNLQAEFSQRILKRPRRLAMWPTTPQGASHSGKFVAALRRALDTFNENDTSIPLNEVFRRMLPELGDIEPLGYLPDQAVLRNPLHSPTPVVMNLDAYKELRRVISNLPGEIRSHFLNKAQGAEIGDLAWYFEGREKESRTLCSWLRDAPAGMRIVTGAAGAGKSALLGHLSVLADDELVEAYAATGLAPGLNTGPRPPSAVFDATIHLTGKTLADVLDNIHDQADETLRDERADDEVRPEVLKYSGGTSSDLIRYLRRLNLERPLTVLADALDEAQEPVRIADLLRRLVRSGVARVLVGTRRSLGEGPDQPYDPEDNELLDALEASDEELVILDNDQDAIRSYVVQRLSADESPYVEQQATIRALADRIATLDQPFLFARLATSELLARLALDLDDPELEMLNEGHVGIFGAAVNRIESQEPTVAAMMRALAWGRGRGLPESGGTWVTAARAVAGDMAIPDIAVRASIEIAAPYITLDAEAGQSTYRLAHQTFVEYYKTGSSWLDSESTEVERLLAEALLKLVDSSGGWMRANYYWVRYLPSYLESGMSFEGLASLVTDAGWLTRAIDLLGVDGVINSISGGGPCLSPAAYAVQKTLRRSRIALSRDPGQLAGQMLARLRNNSDARLAGLGLALTAESQCSTLAMRYGAMDWRADLETTYGLVGKVRALAFGRVENNTLLAIGVDAKIHLWDPLLGVEETRIIDNDGRRINALAFAELEGRPVLAIASYYDGQMIVIRNASTGDQIGEPIPLVGYIDSLVFGLLGGRLAVVGCGNGDLVAMDFQTRLPIPLPEALREAKICGVSELEGQVVAHVARVTDFTPTAWVVDVATGADVWRFPMPLDGELGLVTAGYDDRDGFIVTGYVDRDRIISWSPKERKELERLDAGKMFDVPIRALAFARVGSHFGGRKVVALAPDYDSTTLVRLCQIEALPAEGDVAQFRFVSGPQWRGPDIKAIFSLDDGPLAVLTDSPVALYDLDSNGADPPFDSSPDQATIAFAVTGLRGSYAAFVVDSPDDGLALSKPPGDPTTQAYGLPIRNAAFSLDEPAEWPRTAICWGQMGERAVVATGSVDGAVWIWDTASGRSLAGPLKAISPRVLASGWSIMSLKGAPPCVESLAIGQHPHHGDIVAVAIDGRVRLISLPAGEELPTPTERATVITSVALGWIRDEDVLVTGSKGGVIIVWSLASGTRIASLTLDKGIEAVWVVHGADSVAARANKEVYVMDVLPGSEFD